MENSITLQQLLENGIVSSHPRITARIAQDLTHLHKVYESGAKVNGELDMDQAWDNLQILLHSAFLEAGRDALTDAQPDLSTPYAKLRRAMLHALCKLSDHSLALVLSGHFDD